MKHYQYPFYQHHYVKPTGKKKARNKRTVPTQGNNKRGQLKAFLILLSAFVAGVIVGVLS